MNRFIVISGCSGGGKSTLLSELQRRGYAVVEEPGRRIVAAELKGPGLALPWVNPTAFAERAIAMSRRDRDKAASMPGLVFFDRGLIDAAAALEYATQGPILNTIAVERYNQLVFVTPPWPEMFINDAERRHSLQDAIAEYDRLLVAFASLGYDVDLLPRVDVAKRADMVLARLKSG